PRRRRSPASCAAPRRTPTTSTCGTSRTGIASREDRGEAAMKGVVFLVDRKLELRDFPDPAPGPRDVVLEIKASGMCGSDLHVYRAPFKPGDASSGFKRGAEPVIAGHEPCGVVVAVGTGVTPKEAHSGQRVMDHHYTGCGNCKHC